jgi:tetratricopeptide (TPR) repeat protein
MNFSNTNTMKRIFFSALVLGFGIQAHSQTLNEAKVLTLNEQHEAASSMFLQLVAKFPMKGDYWYYFGDNLLHAENADSAQILFTRGVQEEPSNPLNYIGLGKIYKGSGKQADAAAAFTKALSLGADKNPEVMIRIAEAHITMDPKNLAEAFKLLQAAEKLQPKNPEIQILQGDAFLENNDGTSAIKYYEKAKTLDSKSPAATLRLGQLWVRARNYQGKDGDKGALEYYREAIELSPNFAPAYRELGDLYALAQRFDDAKENYSKYLQLSKGNLTAKRRYAAFMYKTKDYKGALQQLEEIAAVDTGYNINNRLAAYCYFETKVYDKGLSSIEKFFAKQPENKLLSSDFEYYGKLLSASGKDSLAVVKLSEAIAKDSSNADLYSDIAAIYAKQKKHPEAIAMYQKKLDMGKAITNDYFRMGQSLFQTQQYGKADTAFAKVTESQPKLMTGHVWRAKANANLDPDSKLGLAKPYYEKVVELGEVDSTSKVKYKKELTEAYRYLGAYYFLVAADKPTAIGYWEKVLALVPDDKQAKQVLDDLKKK